jgi:hypothetical protein
VRDSTRQVQLVDRVEERSAAASTSAIPIVARFPCGIESALGNEYTHHDVIEARKMVTPRGTREAGGALDTAPDTGHRALPLAPESGTHALRTTSHRCPP